MAKFNMELPTDIMKDFDKVYKNSEEIFGGMTKAGAQVVYSNVRSNIPQSLKDSRIMGCLRLTRVYKTPSDGGINTKVGFYGYFTNKEGKKTPAPLVANMFEYGSHKRKYPKQPFFRRSFRKAQIEKAMLEAQKKLSGGLLEND